jgi:hypothetical protein
MRKLLVQCAHHILGHYGKDFALRQWAWRNAKAARKRRSERLSQWLASCPCRYTGCPQDSLKISFDG